MKKLVIGFIIVGCLAAVSAFLIFKLNIFNLNSAAQPAGSQNASTTENSTAVDKEINYGTAPYTGEKLTKDNVNNIPFMVIVENSPAARPQSGLVDADIIFETMAEGGIPRFLALFQSKTPEKIGPVRSVRTYFIDISKEFNLPFAHCGGNEDALQQIKVEKLMSINEIASGSYFYRDNSRYAPHNLYTNYKSLSQAVTDKNYVKKQTSIHFKYDKNYFKKDTLGIADSINIVPNANYNTSYEFKDGKYYKSMDGTASRDLTSNVQIAVKNIILQYTSMTLKSVELGLDIKLTGSGKGIIISNGKYINVTWSKSSVSSVTVFKDEHGNIVPLAPGNTIWHIIGNNTKVNISWFFNMNLN